MLRTLDLLRATFTETQARDRLSAQPDRPTPPALRGSRSADRASIAALWEKVRGASPATAQEERLLADPDTLDCAEAYAASIENMIGSVKVPLGVIGPLRINGLNANGDFLVPLATTEAALVASYGRGAEIVSRAGGASAAMLMEGVLRSPGFKFARLIDAGLFVDWVVRACDELKAAAEQTTRHGRLVSLEPVMDNDIVFLLCRFTTGDAAGQNMVTIATDALCRHIEAHCPVKPLHWFIEANFSGDKKSTYLGLITGRGRKVTASVTIPGALVEKHLHVDIDRMMDYARMARLGAMLSGQIGAQGHYANGLAAFYKATGQDAACVSESAIGFRGCRARVPRWPNATGGCRASRSCATSRTRTSANGPFVGSANPRRNPEIRLFGAPPYRIATSGRSRSGANSPMHRSPDQTSIRTAQSAGAMAQPPIPCAVR